MKKKILVGMLMVMMAFSLSGNAMAKKYELKLGILSAAGGLEDQAARKIAEVAAEKSGGQLENDERTADQMMTLVQTATKIPTAGERMGNFRRLSGKSSQSYKKDFN